MLALVLLLAGLFTIATFGVGDDLVRLLHSNSGSYLQRRANFAAYAALQRCLSELDRSTSYDASGAAYYSSWSPGETLTDIPMPGDPEVTYTVRVFNNSQTQLGADYVHSDGTRVPGGCVYLKVTSQACPGARQRGRNYSADIASLSFVGQVHWQHVLLGSHRITLRDGVLVDSFDSREAAAYPNGLTTLSSQPQATICSNAQKEAIRLLSGSQVKGKVRWGPGAAAEIAFRRDPDVVVSGDAKASEGLYRIPRFRPPFHPDRAVERVVVHAGEVRLLEPGPYHSLRVEPGGRVRLRSARYLSQTAEVPRYFFDESVQIDGGLLELAGEASGEADSRVEVYVGDTFNATRSAQVNPWRDSVHSRSNRLQIFFVGNGSTQSPQKLTLDQQSGLWAVVAGRGLSCSVDHGSHFYGALRAYEVTLDHGSQAHWDRAVLVDSRIRGLVAWTLQGVFSEKLDFSAMDFGGTGSDYDPGTGGGAGDSGGGSGGDGDI